MPHAIFFDLHGHAVHGFFDVKHLGLPVSHGCVRLSPDHAATLFDLVKTEGMKETTVIVSGRTPGADGVPVARRNAPVEQNAAAQADADRAGLWRPSRHPITGSSSNLIMRSNSHSQPRPLRAAAAILSHSHTTRSGSRILSRNPLTGSNGRANRRPRRRRSGVSGSKSFAAYSAQMRSVPTFGGRPGAPQQQISSC